MSELVDRQRVAMQRCLDVGAGGGSIATWLADRVGPTGHVLATDLDPGEMHRGAHGT